MNSRTRSPQFGAMAQLQGLFGTVLLVFSFGLYVALQNMAAYAARAGSPMSIWEIYVAPILLFAGAVHHYWMAIRIARGSESSLFARLAPISMAGILLISRLF